MWFSEFYRLLHIFPNVRYFQTSHSYNFFNSLNVACQAVWSWSKSFILADNISVLFSIVASVDRTIDYTPHHDQEGCLVRADGHSVKLCDCLRMSCPGDSYLHSFLIGNSYFMNWDRVENRKGTMSSIISNRFWVEPSRKSCFVSTIVVISFNKFYGICCDTFEIYNRFCKFRLSLSMWKVWFTHVRSSLSEESRLHYWKLFNWGWTISDS